MLPECSVSADIGCDHGLLPIYLIEKGIAQKVIAMDVAKGPLGKCIENVSAAGLNEKITTRLSDGLKELEPGEAEAITILGMGGPLMEYIINEGYEVAKAASVLVLSPQSKIPEFRDFLYEKGFYIEDETYLKDEGKDYFIMRVRFLPEFCTEKPLSEEGRAYGPVLVKNKPAEFVEYLTGVREFKQRLIEELGTKDKTDKNLNRLEELKEDLRIINKVI